MCLPTYSWGVFLIFPFNFLLVEASYKYVKLLLVHYSISPVHNSVSMTPDDTSLLHALRNPDTRDHGFRMLMKQYGEKLYWHVRRIVIGHEDAEDVLQDSILQIYNNIHRFSGDASQLRSWIYRIATNEALQMLRRHTHLFQSIDDLRPELIERLRAEVSVEASQPEYLLQEALLRLPTQQRLVFNMRYFDEMPYEDIAKVTGKRVGTLKTNYHFAKTKIEEYLKNHTL